MPSSATSTGSNMCKPSASVSWLFNGVLKSPGFKPTKQHWLDRFLYGRNTASPSQPQKDARKTLWKWRWRSEGLTPKRPKARGMVKAAPHPGNPQTQHVPNSGLISNAGPPSPQPNASDTKDLDKWNELTEPGIQPACPRNSTGDICVDRVSHFN